MADRLIISANDFKLQYALIDASAYVNGVKMTGTGAKLYNVTIYAPNGIALDADESCEITNCILEGSTKDIDIASGKTVTSKNNCFHHHNSKTNNVGVGTLSDINSLFGQDPCFNDLIKRDFTLRFDSPCIDKGFDLGLTEDINGILVISGKINIGAYESVEEWFDFSPIFNFNFNF